VFTRACQACNDRCSSCLSLTQCTSCQPGYLLHRGACVEACPDSFYKRASDATCQSCPVTCATCSETGTGVACHSCRPKFSLHASTCSRTCPAGLFTRNQICTPCQAGTYTASATDASICSVCLPGQYQSLAGQSSCELCARGSAQPNSGRTACQLCPTRTYQSLLGQPSCLSCVEGYTVSSDRSACRGTYPSQPGLEGEICRHQHVLLRRDATFNIGSIYTTVVP
jgi:hypothetical protein